MADNITAPAAGIVLATDDISSVHHPLTKIEFGANGSATPVSADDPLPVVAALPTGASTAAAQATAITALADILAALGATITVDGTIALDAGTLAALETIELGATTIAALENITATVTGVATAANQSSIIGHVDGIEASLASILAKIIAAPATEAKQDTLIGHVDGIEAATATIGTRAYGAAETRVAYTGTSAQSAAITATEVLLHNCGTARCYVTSASNPTATVNDIPLEAGEKFHMRITSGHKIAALQDSAGGNLNIVPVA